MDVLFHWRGVLNRAVKRTKCEYQEGKFKITTHKQTFVAISPHPLPLFLRFCPQNGTFPTKNPVIPFRLSAQQLQTLAISFMDEEE